MVEEKHSIRGVPWARLEPRSAPVEGLPPIVARLLAHRGIEDADAFLSPHARQLPDPLDGWAGTERVAVSSWDAAGICSAVLLCEALRGSGVPSALLHPDGRPAPTSAVRAIAAARGVIAGHPSAGSLLLRLLKLGAVGVLGEDLRRPRPRSILAVGMQELDLGRQGPGLASAMNASMAFPGGLVAEDLRRLARRLELGGPLSLELLLCSDPTRARELGALLQERPDPAPRPWERPPPERYDVELVVAPDELSFRLQADIARLEPCGPGNPEPLVAVERARLTRLRVIKRTHLKATLDGVDVIWRGGARFRDLLDGAEVTLLGTFGLSSWQGILRRQLRLVDALVH